MTHLNFIIAAYAVFVVVLGWDYLSTRLQIRRQLRNARLRAAREASRPGPGNKSATALIR